MLLRHLPRESAYVQAVAGEAARWSDAEHLLAGVIDAVQVGNYLMTAGFHFKGKPKPPKPIRRPGDKPDKAKLGGRRYTQEQMRSILDTWGDGAGDEFESREVT